MAAAKKIPHDEFKREIPAIRQVLAGRPGCDKAIAALAKVRGNTADLPELVAELQAIEPEIRASIADAKEHDPQLARGLSKLADVAACADFLTPEEMLEKLEFLKART
jgi:ferritin-like protein